jgi:hypothetical protein
MDDPRLPFNSICASCCSLEATRRYCVARCLMVEPGTYEKSDRLGETSWPHLHRVCKVCGYEWLERCLGIVAGG